MNFSIINITLVESYGDTAWDFTYQVGINIDNGKILYPDNFKFNKNADYSLHITIFEHQQGYINKIDQLQTHQQQLIISYDLLKFFKTYLLKDKLEEKMVMKNKKEKTNKI